MKQDKKEQIEETEDPIQTIYTYLINGQHKTETLQLVQILEQSFIADKLKLNQEMQLAINHIFASVYAWNNYFEDAERLHTTFFINEQWCLNNKSTIESYLILCLAKNNTAFIQQLWQNPIVKNNFNHLYKAYLGSMINPNSEEHFNLDLLPYYQKLLTAQNLYNQ